MDTNSNIKNKNTALILAIIGGFWGIDRFYRGMIGTGILKLLTFGGFGVWYIYDIVTIAGSDDGSSNNNGDRRMDLMPEQTQDDSKVNSNTINTNNYKLPITLKGSYFSSHPEITGLTSLTMDIYSDGILVHNGMNKSKRIEVKRFSWNEIYGFDRVINKSSQASQQQTSSRVTLTRMALVGPAALAIPKKKKHTTYKGSVEAGFHCVLYTTTGNIELEDSFNSGNSGNMVQGLYSILIAKTESNLNQAKRFIAENAKAVD